MLAAEQTGNSPLYWYQPRMLAEAGNGNGRLHIDLGSGLGTFLAVSRKQGWKSLGVDVSASAAATAKQALQIDTHVGDFLALPRPDDPVGWISAFEVLEHVYAPKAYVEFMHDLLEPGGLVTVSVPNGQSREEQFSKNPILIPPTHINYFSRQGLRQMFETAGFETVYDYIKPIAWGEIARPKWAKLAMLPWLVADRVLFNHAGNRLLWVGRKRR